MALINRKLNPRLETMFLASCREKFDLVFLDPPYQSGLLEEALNQLTRFDILQEYGIIMCESAAEWALPPLAPPYEWGREYRYGKIKLTVCRRNGSVER